MEVRIDEIKIMASRREIDPAKVAELADSIREIGLLNPITITPDKTLIAGLHRIEAHRLLGLDTIEATERNLDGLRVEMAGIDENVARNNLHWVDEDDAWRRRKEIYKLLHPETQHGGDRRSADFKVRNSQLDQSFAADASAKTGKSARTIHEGLQRAEYLTQEVKKALKEKDVRKTDATLIARLEPEKQQQVVDHLNGFKSVRKAIQEVAQEEKRELLKPAEPPSGKYRVIYADPPWSYDDKRAPSTGGCEDNYPTMSLDALCRLPVKDLADNNSVLFLWVTSPMFRDCFQLIDAWGFQYKASFVWDKVKHNMGHYNSVRHELLLICTRGRCMPDKPKLYDSVLSVERTGHSHKPAEFRNIIDDLYDGKRIELFAREKTEGWALWGNEPAIAD